MSLFKKIFGGSNDDNSVESSVSAQGNKQLSPQFGRYTDCNKNRKQLDGWSNAIKAFDQKNYVDSFEQFMIYLGDESLGNLNFKRNGDEVTFDFIQGSRKVTGYGNKERFFAETNIAEMPEASIPVMRKLMNLNYGMQYSKFALNEALLCVKFSSHSIDASPNKLYSALKELSKKADKQDDLLLGEFSSLKEVDTEHIIPINEKEQEIQFRYLHQFINDTLAEVNQLDAQKMAGGIAFLLLDLTYKIDYLIRPEGELTDVLEQIQMIFFEKTDASTTDRNNRIIALFKQILSEPKDKIYASLYAVKCTFGIANPAAHKKVMDMMFDERKKVDWYRNNRYPKIVEAVYGYMISYAFFNYGMVYPVTDCLSLAMEVLNPKYYEEMGVSNQLISNGQLDGKRISKIINEKLVSARTDYPFLKLNTTALRYDSAVNFIDSLILELDKFDLRKN